MKKVLVTAALCILGAASVQAADLGGEWARGDGKARVKIEPCGDNICAINTWIKPGTPKEKTGDRLVMTIKPSSEGQYSGSAFDPQRNMTYNISVSVKGDSMTTKGCIVAGLLCKGVEWSRIGS